MDENKVGQDQNQSNFNGQIPNSTSNSNNDGLSIFSGIDTNVSSINNNIQDINTNVFESTSTNDAVSPVSNVGESFISEPSNSVQNTNIFESASTSDAVSPLSNVGESFTPESSNNTQDINTNIFGKASTNDVVSPISNVGESFVSEPSNSVQNTNVFESASTNDVVSPVSNIGENSTFESSNNIQDINTSSTENSNTVSEQTAEIVTIDLDDTNNSQPVQEPQTQTSQINSENDIKPKKEKKKKGKSFLILFLLLLLAIIGGAIYFYFNGYSKFVLSRNIAKAYNSISNVKIDSTLENILKSNAVSLDYNMNLDIKDNAELLGGINNLSIKYTYSENKNDKKGLLNLESKINKEEFVNLDALLKDNKIYFKIKNAMDKYYFTDFDFISLFESLENSDSKYIFDIVKDSILTSIENKDLKQTNEEIVVNNKSLKTVKISLNIDEKLLIKISKNLFKKIENDDKALEILAKNFKISKEELKKEISEMKSSIDDNNSSLSNEENIVYNMYTDILGNAIKHELIMDDYTLDYSNYNDVKELTVKSNGLDAFNIKIEGKETGTISGNIMQAMSITGDYTTNKVNLDMKAIDNSMEIKIALENKENKVSDKEYAFDSTLNVSVLADNSEALNANLKFDGKFASDITINEVNTENSKNINDVTEEEIENIFSKLEELPAFGLFTNQMILNSVGEAKEQAAVSSANNIISASNVNEQLSGFDEDYISGNYTSSRGTGANANKITSLSSSVSFSGDRPTYLNLTTDNEGTIVSGVIEVSGYCVKVSNGYASVDGIIRGTCN